MLIRFRVANHRSLRDEQVLHFTAATRSNTPAVATSFGARLVRAVGIYGANASGKSNLLHALQFVKAAVSDSFRLWPTDGGTAHEPFLLERAASKAPSEYELDFIAQGVPYTYGFRLDGDAILAEWLWSYPHGRRQRWFVRTTADGYYFGKSLRGPNRAIEQLTRPNSLFLSAAAQNNHPLLKPIQAWLNSRIRFATPANAGQPSDVAPLKESGFRATVLALLRAADLGITDLSVREEAFDDTTREFFDDFASAIEHSGEHRVADLVYQLKQQGVITVSLQHRSADAPEGVSLPFDNESYGTRALFHLSLPVLKTLAAGGLLCVDELDASLHPTLVRAIVALFQDESKNPHHAQLLFNANDTSLLHAAPDQAPLFRDQIWFTEKSADGATTLYPLTDFHPRRQENIQRGYLQGRYGAVPVIGFDDLSPAADNVETDTEMQPEQLPLTWRKSRQ